jgi:hypothetical protein
MNHLLIEFSLDRRYSGALSLFNQRGDRICGPYPVAGRSTSSLAAAHGNARRDPTLLYGDTPTGSYRLSQILKSGKGTSLSTAEFGPHGVAVIEATSGAAAAAEANGRFHLLIEAGQPAADGALRSTVGALRLANEHLRILIAALRKGGELRCDVVELEGGPQLGLVVDDECCEDEDPVPLPRGERGWDRVWAKNASRRTALRSGAAGAAGLMALRLSVAFLAVDAVGPLSALAYGASPSGDNMLPPPLSTVTSDAMPRPISGGTGAETGPPLELPDIQPRNDAAGPASVPGSDPSGESST